jgi:hypothetical protein
MVRVAAAAEQAYASLCSTLGDILVEAPVRIVGGITAIQLAAHPYLQLWNEERDRLAKVCKLALDAGVAERQVRIAEGEGGQIHDAMLGLLTDLGLDGEALLAAKRKAAARLRVMAGGAAA